MIVPDPVRPPPDRRDFLKKILAGCIGALAALIPVAAGFTVFVDPLRRHSSTRGAILVTALEALPDDAIPRKFPVLATRVDAWNKFTQVPIGAVYLRRTGGDRVQAFNVVCPHAGCFVDFLPERMQYLCPCHKATYTVEGRIADRASPAPRGLDSLEVEIRGGKEVWVKFQNFQAGHAEKLPVA